MNHYFFAAVNDLGEVTSFDFLTSSNARIMKEVQDNLVKLKFKPARKGQKAVKSYVIVKHEFRLVEDESKPHP